MHFDAFTCVFGALMCTWPILPECTQNALSTHSDASLCTAHALAVFPSVLRKASGCVSALECTQSALECLRVQNSADRFSSLSLHAFWCTRVCFCFIVHSGRIRMHSTCTCTCTCAVRWKSLHSVHSRALRSTLMHFGASWCHYSALCALNAF